MKVRLFVIVILISFSSCSSNGEESGYVDLGNGFKYIKGYPQTIIYSTSKESPSSGKNIVEPIVINYGLTENKIFVISRGEPAIPSKNIDLYGPPKYWIINKEDETSGTQLIDSTLFYSELKRLDVQLVL